MQSEMVDYVIVGGGSAGNVLANRLSADPGVSVLVLEAGPRYRPWDLLVRMPVAVVYAVGSPRLDWQFMSEPEPHLDGRRLSQPRGKVLGGSSSINGMTYLRGLRGDYDRWADVTGERGWDYAHCAPYFARFEGATAAETGPTRGLSGPHNLVRGPADNPLCGMFLRAAEEAGYPLSPDLNEWQDGFGIFERTVRRGRRETSADAYLGPVGDRSNLKVQCKALVTRILLDGKRASGVQYRAADGTVHEVTAGEVLLCGGAINSPHLLQLSGIGDATALASLGIPLVHHLPGVGQHLQDHLGLFVQHACSQPLSLSWTRKRSRWPGMGLSWLLFGRGRAASTTDESGGLMRSDPSLEQPDMLVAFAPKAENVDPRSVMSEHGYQLYIAATRPTSAGSVSLRSTDPTEHPVLRFNYLATKEDQEFWPRAIRSVREIFDQPAFASVDGGETVPGPSLSDDDALLSWVRRSAGSGYHPTSTCRMGVDEGAVVDPKSLRVHGVDGLRVVDASVMPDIVSSNTYSTVVMIAEKAADMILGQAAPQPADLSHLVTEARPGR